MTAREHDFCSNKQCNLWMPKSRTSNTTLCAFCDPVGHGERRTRSKRAQKGAKKD
jgi:hypothetical protein